MVEPCETTQPQMPRSNDSGQRGTLIAIAVYLVFYTGMILFNAFPPRLPTNLWGMTIWALLPPLSTILYLLLLTNTLRQICRLHLGSKREVLLMLLALLLFMILNPAIRDAARLLLKGENFSQILVHLAQVPDEGKSLYGIVLLIIVPFMLILTGAFFGQIIAGLIHERAMLVPVGIIAGLVDFWGVFWGPVKSWSDAAPTVVMKMASAASAAVDLPSTVKLPPQLALFGHISPPSAIGIGDFVFLAFFLTCAYRLGFSAKRTMWGIFFGMLLSSIILALNGQTLFGITISIAYLPGLVFISGGMLLANIGAWQLSRAEWGMTAAVVGIFLICISCSIYLSQANQPHPSHQGYTFKTASAGEALRQLRARLTENMPRGTELLLVRGGVFFMRPPHAGARAVQWEFFAIERRPQAKLQQLHDYLIAARYDAKAMAYQVSVDGECPPDVALRILAMFDPRQADKSALLNHAHTLPDSALAFLDTPPMPTHAGTPPPAQFVLNLLPNYGMMVVPPERKGQKVPYPATR